LRRQCRQPRVNEDFASDRHQDKLPRGRDELGDHFFELCRELDGADLGAELVVYGYQTGAHDPQIFEIDGKGQIIDRMALRYAVETARR
jgi:hypothetical protein